jgi:hypothetical protein
LEYKTLRIPICLSEGLLWWEPAAPSIHPQGKDDFFFVLLLMLVTLHAHETNHCAALRLATTIHYSH